MLSKKILLTKHKIIYMNNKRSKRYREISQKIELNKKYSLTEALKLLQENNQEKSKNIKMAVSLH